MNTLTLPTDDVPADIAADLEAVCTAVAEGRRPDPEVLARVRDRAAKNREEIFRRNGLLDVAVPTIRDLRDGDVE